MLTPNLVADIPNGLNQIAALAQLLPQGFDVHMQCITVMLIPIVSIAALHGLAVAAADCIIKTPIAAFFILGGIMMINVIVFILYDFMSGQSAMLLEHEKEKSKFDLEKQRYEALIRQDREMGAIIHDSYKHLRILSSLADSGDMEDMSAYIKKLDKDAHEAFGETIVPGYPAIDAVLRQKISEARSRGMAVAHEINLFPGIAIEPVGIWYRAESGNPSLTGRNRLFCQRMNGLSLRIPTKPS